MAEHTPAVTDVELARMLATLAADLDHRGHPWAGTARQAARRLAQLDDTTGLRCPCGAEIPRNPGAGRPRTRCTKCRPPRARNSRKLQS